MVSHWLRTPPTGSRCLRSSSSRPLRWWRPTRCSGASSRRVVPAAAPQRRGLPGRGDRRALRGRVGFLVVTVWTAFDNAQQTADTEAGKVADAYGFAYGLPEPTRSRVQRAARHVRARGSRRGMARRCGTSTRIRKARAGCCVDTIRTLILAPPPPAPNVATALRNEARYQAVVNDVREIADARRLRLIQAESRLPRALYLSLVLGGMMVLIFVFLFGVESGTVQLIMTATVAGCIGLLARSRRRAQPSVFGSDPCLARRLDVRHRHATISTTRRKERPRLVARRPQRPSKHARPLRRRTRRRVLAGCVRPECSDRGRASARASSVCRHRDEPQDGAARGR